VTADSGFEPQPEPHVDSVCVNDHFTDRSELP
jgi:hypothetical protein